MASVGKHVWFLAENELGEIQLKDGLVTQISNGIATVLVINKYGDTVEDHYPLYKVSAQKLQFTHEDGLILYTYHLKSRIAESKNSPSIGGHTHRMVK